MFNSPFPPLNRKVRYRTAMERAGFDVNKNAAEKSSSSNFSLYSKKVPFGSSVFNTPVQQQLPFSKNTNTTQSSNVTSPALKKENTALINSPYLSKKENIPEVKIANSDDNNSKSSIDLFVFPENSVSREEIEKMETENDYPPISESLDKNYQSTNNINESTASINASTTNDKKNDTLDNNSMSISPFSDIKNPYSQGNNMSVTNPSDTSSIITAAIEKGNFEARQKSFDMLVSADSYNPDKDMGELAFGTLEVVDISIADKDSKVQSKEETQNMRTELKTPVEIREKTKQEDLKHGNLKESPNVISNNYGNTTNSGASQLIFNEQVPPDILEEEGNVFDPHHDEIFDTNNGFSSMEQKGVYSDAIMNINNSNKETQENRFPSEDMFIKQMEESNTKTSKQLKELMSQLNISSDSKDEAMHAVDKDGTLHEMGNSKSSLNLPPGAVSDDDDDDGNGNHMNKSSAYLSNFLVDQNALNLLKNMDNNATIDSLSSAVFFSKNKEGVLTQFQNETQLGISTSNSFSLGSVNEANDKDANSRSNSTILSFNEEEQAGDDASILEFEEADISTSTQDPSLDFGSFPEKNNNNHNGTSTIEDVVEETKPLSITYPAGEGPCRTCNQEILPHEKRIYSKKDNELSGQWHRKCFHCSKCELKFNRNIACYILDDMPYCQFHYHVTNNSICRTCSGFIEGECLESDAKERFHIKCLTCFICHQIINEDYYIYNNLLAICTNHDLDQLVEGGLEGDGNTGANSISKRRTHFVET
ncbi:Pxl1p SCDLUD_005293 [Saccharomycodes ludwigii]|uniref:Pxl1p n=1 Tax=Saccharomycodes ludwigii TaxID=36035 RepID=UPI001E867296|nr:hypothetical protein SCDLUD_005293 [Saccharomycodes ludwigii]KAH3898946.1 hypothetical protein SCDLUD_005293 [Saccharomycodes ludwigii]